MLTYVCIYVITYIAIIWYSDTSLTTTNGNVSFVVGYSGVGRLTRFEHSIHVYYSFWRLGQISEVGGLWGVD